MKSLKKFIVKLPKKFNDTVKIGDTEIYIETKYNEFQHRVMEGEVVGLPAKYETPVKEGDTIYFHHHVVLQGGKPLPGMEGCYMVMYDPEVAMNSQAFAYKCKDTGKVESLSTWCLLEPVEEEVKLKSDILEVVDYSTKNPTQGKVVYACNRCEDLGVKVGDVVGIGKNRDYVIKIDDKEYYRTRSEDFLYVVEE
jgi:co-chaperonin GroES (HSP10)